MYCGMGGGGARGCMAAVRAGRVVPQHAPARGVEGTGRREDCRSAAREGDATRGRADPTSPEVQGCSLRAASVSRARTGAVRGGGRPSPSIAPFCTHTTKRQIGEFICAGHWHLIPSRTRRRWLRLRCATLQRRRSQVGLDRVWEIVKRTAIERAAGIGP